MSELTFVHQRTMSEQYHALSGLAWNIILLLFAGAWLAGTTYTLYGLFANFGEMSFLWLVFSTALLGTLGIIAGIGTAVALMGIYAYSKALVPDTDASFW